MHLRLPLVLAARYPETPHRARYDRAIGVTDLPDLAGTTFEIDPAPTE